MIRASKWIIRLVWVTASAALAVAALASVGAAVRTVVATSSLPGSAITAAPAPTLPTRPPQATYAALSTSQVFGTLAAGASAGPAPAPMPVVEDLPVTSLNLRLVGTVAGLGPDSLAVIADQTSRTQTTFTLGDEVAMGATLEAVQARRVVLLRNGQREQLEMLDAAVALPLGGKRGTRENRRTAAGRTGRTRRGTAAVRAATASTAIRRINDNLRVINREEFEREAGLDLVQTVTRLRTEPRYVGGAPSGVRLVDTGYGQLMADLGFQQGDVIVSVNGQRVNTAADLALLSDNLNTASDVRVQIIRGNLPRTLIYKVR